MGIIRVLVHVKIPFKYNRSAPRQARLQASQKRRPKKNMLIDIFAWSVEKIFTVYTKLENTRRQKKSNLIQRLRRKRQENLALNTKHEHARRYFHYTLNLTIAPRTHLRERIEYVVEHRSNRERISVNACGGRLRSFNARMSAKRLQRTAKFQ